MKLFDPQVYHLHTQRAKKTFHDHDFLFTHVGHEMITRLQDFKKSFHTPLILSPYSLPYSGQHHCFLEEILPFPQGSFDLILSCLQAHWVNDLPGLLKSIHTCLKAESLFMGALWGGKTLFELRESLLKAEIIVKGGASPRISPMLHPADAPGLLGKTGFFMPVVDTETITVTYPCLNSLMKDLKGMG